MFRVSASGKLLQERVAFVMQLLVNPDLRRVVPVYRRVLDGAEKLFLDGLRRFLILADRSEQFYLLICARVSEGLAELFPAHLVNRYQTLAPGVPGDFGGFADDQVDVRGDAGSFCSRRMIVGRNDALGHLD